MNEAHVERFEQRRVALSEARPASGLLAEAQRLVSPVQSGPGAAGYRVHLQQRRGEGEPVRNLILAKQGRSSLRDRQSYGGRHVFIMTPGGSISYFEELNGRPRDLNVSAGAQELAPGDWVPVDGRPPETVLEQTCTWMRPPMIVHDAAYHECRTRDGLPLIAIQQQRGSFLHYEAVSVQRGALPPETFAIPAKAIDWAGWSVRLDR